MDPGRADRGQVPFGNAILYGAMALVVVGAAGLVIATGGFSETLSLNASEPDDTARPDMTVLSAVADHRTEDGLAYGVVTVTAQVPEGADPVPVSNLSARWVDGSGVATLAPARENRTDVDGHFGVVEVRDPDDSFPRLTPGDRVRLVFDLGPRNDVSVDDAGAGSGQGATFFGSAMPVGHGATLVLRPGAGVNTTVSLQAPDEPSGAVALLGED